MLVIRREQQDALVAKRQERFVQEMMRYLRSAFPARLEEYAEPQLRDLVWNGLRRAIHYGLESRTAAAKFIELTVVVAPDFDTSPDAEWLLPVLEDTEMPGDERAEYVYQQLRTAGGI
jgi:hypothetical protein